MSLSSLERVISPTKEHRVKRRTTHHNTDGLLRLMLNGGSVDQCSSPEGVSPPVVPQTQPLARKITDGSDYDNRLEPSQYFCLDIDTRVTKADDSDCGFVSITDLVCKLLKERNNTKHSVNKFVSKAQIAVPPALEAEKVKEFDVFFLNRKAWDLAPVKNEFLTDFLMDYVIKHTTTLDKLDMHTKCLPCLGKAVIRIVGDKKITVDTIRNVFGTREAEIPIRMVLLNVDGTMRDVCMSDMWRGCYGGSPSERVSYAISRMILCKGYEEGTEFKTYIPHADLINEDHGLYSFYMRRSDPPGIGVFTRFYTIERLANLPLGKDIQIPTDLPVAVFRVCGGVIMNLSTTDLKCILRYAAPL